jgi:hypothetical protein
MAGKPMKRQPKTKAKKDIYDQYRETLEMPKLTRQEIDRMRENLRAIARAICEHVWKKKFY